MSCVVHHLALTASNLRRSSGFYNAVLPLLGYRQTLARDDLAVWEGPEPEILLYAAKPQQRASPHRTYDPGLHHLAFQAPSRGVVEAAYAAAIAAGADALDAPRLYPDYAPTYYAGFFEDPDGIKLEIMTLAES